MVSYKYLLNANGHFTITDKDSAAALVSKLKVASYKPTAVLTAPAGDMAAVYGRVTDVDKRESNYVRVWRKEKEGWRVALEVLDL